jgi:hypothetical protein
MWLFLCPLHRICQQALFLPANFLMGLAFSSGCGLMAQVLYWYQETEFQPKEWAA